jgi:hypothetical protein
MMAMPNRAGHGQRALADDLCGARCCRRRRNTRYTPVQPISQSSFTA